MSTAVYMQKLDANGDPDGNTISFEQYEIMNVNVFPVQKNSIEQNLRGDSYFFLQAQKAYHTIDMQIRIFGDTTQTKLSSIRSQMWDNEGIRIYPVYISNPSYYFDCFISPDINALYIFAGEYKAGDIVNLQFIEYTKQEQVVMDDDEFVV